VNKRGLRYEILRALFLFLPRSKKMNPYALQGSFNATIFYFSTGFSAKNEQQTVQIGLLFLRTHLQG